MFLCRDVQVGGRSIMTDADAAKLKVQERIFSPAKHSSTLVPE